MMKDLRGFIHSCGNDLWSKIFLNSAVVATIIGAVFASKTLIRVEKNIAEVKENARSADLKLTKISAANCTDCFNVDVVIEALKKQNVLVGEEKTINYDSPEGEVLIKHYEIKKVPTYLLTGEITKKSFEGFVKGNGEIKGETFIFTKVTPVFVDPETKKEMGKVTATILADPSCTQCVDPKLTVEAYKKAGIKIADEKEISWNSARGQGLIAQYKITKLPTFLLSSDVDLYDNVKANWSRIGTVEEDRTYVARNLYPPYRDLEKGQVLGLVDVIYLADSSCGDCYKPEEVHRNVLTQGFGVRLRLERTIDIASVEGRNLVSKYKIVRVPTFLLSPDALHYANLKNVWQNVGTVEPNGWYVFREVQQLGGAVYKDLTSDQIIRPVVQSSGQTQQ